MSTRRRFLAAAGAAGLAQWLPASWRPARVVPDVPGRVAAQARWMLGYVRSVYGIPGEPWPGREADDEPWARQAARHRPGDPPW